MSILNHGEAEIAKIICLARAIRQRPQYGRNILIVSPYKAQVALTAQKWEETYPGLETKPRIQAVDGEQEAEGDAVIVMLRTHSVYPGFVASSRRINVMTSRAKHGNWGWVSGQVIREHAPQLQAVMMQYRETMCSFALRGEPSHGRTFHETLTEEIQTSPPFSLCFSYATLFTTTYHSAFIRTCLSAMNPAPEFEQAGRLELIKQISETGVSEIDSVIWAFLWLADMNRVQLLAQYAKNPETSLVCSGDLRRDYYPALRNCTLWSPPTECERPTTRSAKAADDTANRDQHRYIVTKAGEPLQIADLIPFALGVRHQRKTERDKF
ncbi:hypothetical protein ANOM_003219 [Aspergillus nomiae NRRL 13137]|uniref:DNA2/NAM7 helicase-like C-terminal domain-containing protein n=1 Tax=Aspergillus nomiae NRRL (strain ATCC 15546 / NRRL 13137 / CBS 260.88 / M93) TaxID=1509407 RepID=A0A0L1J9W7_ASPN3|nr:uncharacterized protein ANOM_003219 [Aspergillus nomiae NRRL 13137]KNG88480.1 hypothetical protein ANOM_003219 [Aspergillus nomiae NRRL 13137]